MDNGNRHTVAVNPDTSRKLQEIAFKQGWGWGGAHRQEILHLDMTGLCFYPETKTIYHTRINGADTTVEEMLLIFDEMSMSDLVASIHSDEETNTMINLMGSFFGKVMQ